MPTFKVRDLMINVALPEAAVPQYCNYTCLPTHPICYNPHTYPCPNNTYHHAIVQPGGAGAVAAQYCNYPSCAYNTCLNLTCHAYTPCPNPHTLPLPWCHAPTLCQHPSLAAAVTGADDPVAQSASLSAIKQQLQQMMTQVEQQQQALEQNLQPQTLQQVEELQARIRAALEELDQRKAELQQKSTETQK